MPYFIKKVNHGFKVAKVNEPEKTFSRIPLTLDNAKAQMIAIEISESRKAHSYIEGGKVKGRPVKSKYINMKFNTADLKGDTVPAVLTVGEIVIPKPKVKIVSEFLKKKHIKLPNL